MTTEELQSYLGQKFPDAIVAMGNQYPEMTVGANQLFETAKLLKEEKETQFDYLFCLSGVDFANCMGVYYHIESTNLKHCMVLNVKTSNRTEPILDSVMAVWHGAKYHEREVYDLLGIHFNNHNDLRRLFLEDGWGFPLRKDYVDEERIIAR